ncbi:Proteasome inhibitor PI31 subunit [Lamellibrachia satsuma]|nr:Proteasome inhibitor PI31 subunit [Lamellibrachia satsuma]
MAGLEVLFASIRSQLNGPEDALVCAFHWCMISNGFRCIGCGETEPCRTISKTEMLPEGWNASQDVYTLHYQPENSNGNTHLLKVVKADHTLLIHVMRQHDNLVHNLTVDLNKYTTGEIRDFAGTYCSLKDLQQKFKIQLLASFTGQQMQQSRQQRERYDPLREPDPLRADPLRADPLRAGPRHPNSNPYFGETSDPFAVGGADLDPLGAGMGGMYMDPRRFGFPSVYPDAGLPSQLPRGAVPPGARFDPFGPPGVHRGEPDNDEAPPPGYDDMFM